MPATVTILGVSGSLRASSTNARLLDAAAHVTGPGVRLRRWIDLRAVPPFAEDAPPPVPDPRGAFAAADAILIATPEYNGSVPGQLKNAIDWASHPPERSALQGRPVAVVGAGDDPDGPAESARDHLRWILAAAGARVVERDLFVARADAAFTADGSLRDRAHQATLSEILDELAVLTRGERPGVPA